MAALKSSSRRTPGRRLPPAEKRRIVELTLEEGASVRAIAREQGVNRNSLYQWQTLYRAGKLGARSRARAGVPTATLLPVTIAPMVRTRRAGGDANAHGGSVIQLMLASGATLRIATVAMDAGLIGVLMAELRR